MKYEPAYYDSTLHYIQRTSPQFEKRQLNISSNFSSTLDHLTFFPLNSFEKKNTNINSNNQSLVSWIILWNQNIQLLKKNLLHVAIIS